MDIKLLKAKVTTNDLTDEQIKNRFDSDTSEKEVINFKNAMQSVDGLEIIVTNSFFSDGDYILTSWLDKDDEKWREFIYVMEQDPMFGTYYDDREEFLKVWEAGEYEPEGMLCFKSSDLEILEKLN